MLFDAISDALPSCSLERLDSVAQKYDPVYCEQNGWLTDDYRALQHDFEAMKVKAEEFCDLLQSFRVVVVFRVVVLGLLFDGFRR